LSNDKLTDAALWLYSNSDTIKGNPLLELMARFSISGLDAVAASRRAHALRFPGGVVAETATDAR
jgi:hypothetical protein